MSQIDLSTFSSIILWTWISILFSFLILYSFTFPPFIKNIKIWLKDKNIKAFKILVNFYKIKKLTNFPIILELKESIKNNKKIWIF